MWGSLLDGLVVQVALDDPVVDAERARKVALDVAYKELGLVAAAPTLRTRCADPGPAEVWSRVRRHGSSVVGRTRDHLIRDGLHDRRPCCVHSDHPRHVHPPRRAPRGREGLARRAERGRGRLARRHLRLHRRRPVHGRRPLRVPRGGDGQLGPTRAGRLGREDDGADGRAGDVPRLRRRHAVHGRRVRTRPASSRSSRARSTTRAGSRRCSPTPRCSTRCAPTSSAARSRSSPTARFTETIAFRDEDSARAGEKKEPPPEVRSELESMMAGARFYDLHHPWFESA